MTDHSLFATSVFAKRYRQARIAQTKAAMCLPYTRAGPRSPQATFEGNENLTDALAKLAEFLTVMEIIGRGIEKERPCRSCEEERRAQQNIDVIWLPLLQAREKVGQALLQASIRPPVWMAAVTGIAQAIETTEGLAALLGRPSWL